MAQVKVYGLKSSLSAIRAELSEAIHESLMEAFALPREKRFQRFFALEREEFLFPEGRSDKYTIVEISVFEGRSAEAKKRLITALYTRVAERAKVSPEDLEITIFETPRSNWGIRGKPGDELALDYKVNV